MINNLIVYFFLFFVLSSFSQNTENLIKEKNTLIQEISYTKDLLSQAKSEKKNNLSTLSLFQRDIELRKSLIQSFDNEINLIEKSIDTLICKLNILYTKETHLAISLLKKKKKINHLFKLYSQSIRNIYLSHEYQNIFYAIISDKSIDRSLNNYVYFKTIINSSKALSQKLSNEQRLLHDDQKKLNENKKTIKLSIKNFITLINDKQLSINDKEVQLESLLYQKEQKQNLVNKLSNEIEQLKKEISEKELNAQKIENEIKIALNKQSEMKNSELNFDVLSQEFQQKKGSLDWPTDNFIIMSSFGKVSHTSLPGIQYINHGIQLAVPRGSSIKSVYSGEVSSIIIQNNYLKSIIIDHGLYFTVYTNLGEVYFQQGDIVLENEPLGLVFIKEKHKTGITEFQIWKEFESQDPKIWLKNVN